MKLMFCMFAEDIGLLPKDLFTRLLTNAKDDPQRLAKLMQNLFSAMSEGGDFGAEVILYFDGGLFADADVIELTKSEIATLIDCNHRDWGDVEPSIFGTLFERTLDPAKRSQIGAHYTSREDILTLLEPVMMTPLRREWDEVRGECDKLWEKVQNKKTTAKTRGNNPKEAGAEATGLRRAAGPHQRTRPRLRQRQLPLRLNQSAVGPQQGSHHLRVDAQRWTFATNSPHATGRHRDQPLCAAAGHSGDLDRLPAMDARQRLPRPARPRPGTDRHD